MWTCFVVSIIADSPFLFRWIRALAGEFVTTSLIVARGLGYTSDISTQVLSLATANVVAHVINCIDACRRECFRRWLYIYIEYVYVISKKYLWHQSVMYGTCFVVFVITLCSFFDRVSAQASTLVAQPNRMTLALPFARRFALAFINLCGTNAFAWTTSIVDWRACWINIIGYLRRALSYLSYR